MTPPAKTLWGQNKKVFGGQLNFVSRGHTRAIFPAADGTSPEYETGTASYCNAPGRFSNLFLIEHLDRGTYTISYDCNITHTGRFLNRAPAVN